MWDMAIYMFVSKNGYLRPPLLSLATGRFRSSLEPSNLTPTSEEALETTTWGNRP